MKKMTLTKTAIYRKGNYLYLRYSYRKEGKIHKLEKFLGTQMPSDSEMTMIYEQFIQSLITEKWENFLSKYHQSSFPKPEASSKVITKEIRDFGINFTYNTNKIEGSTLLLKDVVNIINENQTPKGKNLDEIIETKCHMQLFLKILTTNSELSIDLLCQWHLALFGLSKAEIAGKIRREPVRIGVSSYIPPIYYDEIITHLEDLFQWYRSKKGILHPVLIACLFFLKFESIHPFLDGNGRIGRLAMNFLLYSTGYPMFNIKAIDYRGYYHSLEKSQISKNPVYFVNWFFTKYTLALNQ